MPTPNVFKSAKKATKEAYQRVRGDVPENILALDTVLQLILGNKWLIIQGYSKVVATKSGRVRVNVLVKYIKSEGQRLVFNYKPEDKEAHFDVTTSPKVPLMKYIEDGPCDTLYTLCGEADEEDELQVAFQHLTKVISTSKPKANIANFYIRLIEDSKWDDYHGALSIKYIEGQVIGMAKYPMARIEETKERHKANATGRASTRRGEVGLADMMEPSSRRVSTSSDSDTPREGHEGVEFV